MAQQGSEGSGFYPSIVFKSLEFMHVFVFRVCVVSEFQSLTLISGQERFQGVFQVGF